MMYLFCVELSGRASVMYIHMTILLLFTAPCSKSGLEKITLGYDETEMCSYVLKFCYCPLNFVAFCVTSQFTGERNIVCQLHYTLLDLFLDRNTFKEGILPC
jgi:hypothetical protein